MKSMSEDGEFSNPMELISAAATQGQVTLALVLIATGMRFRDLEYTEAATADVEGFLRDVTGGE
jgi:endo-1,4-beta-D-glucanase Y